MGEALILNRSQDHQIGAAVHQASLLIIQDGIEHNGQGGLGGGGDGVGPVGVVSRQPGPVPVGRALRAEREVRDAREGCHVAGGHLHGRGHRLSVQQTLHPAESLG